MPPDNLEPWIPPAGEMETQRPEFRIVYRDPATGEEFFRFTDSSHVWSERRQLTEAGYQVAVQERWHHITAWKVTEKTR
jgi:hypothetical protein